jgi:hypothetical protein
VINQLFTFSSTIERLRQGPLNEYLDAYAIHVAEQGYAHHSIRQQIVVIADFSRRLKQKQIDVQALESEVVDRFLRLRRRQQRVGRSDPKALQRLLTMLCQIGVVKLKPPVADNAQARLVAEFHATCRRNAVCLQQHCSTTSPSLSSSWSNDFTTRLRTSPSCAHRTSPDSLCAARIS